MDIVDARPQIDRMPKVLVAFARTGWQRRFEAQRPNFAVLPFPAMHAFSHLQQKVVELRELPPKDRNDRRKAPIPTGAPSANS